MLRCPSCLGDVFETLGPGQYRCTNRVVIDAVPPGMGGNLGFAAIPIYGNCGRGFDEQTGQHAAARMAETQAANERERQAVLAAAKYRAAEQENLDRRKIAALAALRAAENPGLRQRHVPNYRRLSFADRFFRLLREDAPADVEPAWLIGVYTWVRPGQRGSDTFEQLDTGYTPSGRYVPMNHGTAGDDVHVLCRCHKLWSYQDFRHHRGKSPTDAETVAILERWIPSV